MKKIFFSLLAIAAIASCAKTEAVYEGDNSEIKIKPATALATKANQLATIDGTEYPVAENFDVYGYWKDEAAGSSFTDGATLYLGLDGAVEFTNKGTYWGGKENAYYWPKNGSLRFAAYSPSSVDMTHDLATDTYTVETYVQPSSTAATWDLLVAPTSKSYTSMTAAENVSVVFEHALSWITINVKAKDAEAAKAFDINKVTINDVITTAKLEAVMSGDEKAMNWTLTDTKAPVVVFEGSQAVAAEPAVIETTANGTLVIPQPTTTITVDYTQNALSGTPALENQKVTVDLVLDTDNSPWKAGKHYVYTLVFGLDEILINPDVVDWDDVVVAEKDYDEFVYTDVEVATGETLTVATDATIEGSVNVAGTLDGAGHTLTVSEAPTDNGMVRPTDGAVIKNVTIDGNNLSWDDNGTSRGLRGVYVNAGGTYTLDNVTIVNTTYAINVNTTQAVTLTVTNSTLQNWTSYGTSTTASFENVEFTAGNYAMFRPYGTTTMKNCAFEAGFEIDLGSQGAANSIVFEGCTYGGDTLAEEHLTNATGKNFTIN